MPESGRPGRPSRRGRLAQWAVLLTVVAVGVAVVLFDRRPPEAPSKSDETHRVARVLATSAPSNRIRDLTIESPALGRQTTVRLLLPTRYAAQPQRRWPVLYLLHGCCDTYLSWTGSTNVEELTAGSDVLVVMPDGGPAGFYSDWRSGRPRWETFHLTELRRILEADYRAGDVRAIGGLSMGGLGALAYTARNPGMFRATASFSGIVHTRLSPETSAVYQRLLLAQGEKPDDLWGDPHDQSALWAAHNPYDLAPNLRGTRLFISVGNGQPGPLDQDGTGWSHIESALAEQNAALRDRLRALQIPAQFDFYGAGTHDWPYWQRGLHRAWPMFEQALGLRRP